MSSVYQIYTDAKKMTDPANGKGQLALNEYVKRFLSRIVHIQRSEILPPITTQLSQGSSHTDSSSAVREGLPNGLKSTSFTHYSQ